MTLNTVGTHASNLKLAPPADDLAVPVTKRELLAALAIIAQESPESPVKETCAALWEHLTVRWRQQEAR